MSGFKDFDELVTRTPKRLPIGGVLFDFPDRISAQTGLLLLAMRTAAAGAGPTPDVEAVLAEAGVTAEQVAAMQDEMLGDGQQRLIESGHGHAIPHVVQTLTVWHLYGQEAAEQAWNSLGPTQAPNRAARRSAGTAKSSPRPASTAGSTSRKKPAKAPSRGGTSSTSGR